MIRISVYNICLKYANIYRDLWEPPKLYDVIDMMKTVLYVINQQSKTTHDIRRMGWRLIVNMFYFYFDAVIIGRAKPFG